MKCDLLQGSEVQSAKNPPWYIGFDMQNPVTLIHTGMPAVKQ